MRSLLMADHTPPSASPWWARVVLNSSLQSLAWTFSRWASLFARKASLWQVFVSVSRLGWFVNSSMSFLMASIRLVILALDSLLCFWAISLMSFLKDFQSVCGFDVPWSVPFLRFCSMASCSRLPLSITRFIRGLFSRDASCQVQRPFPIYGASAGAYRARTIQ